MSTEFKKLAETLSRITLTDEAPEKCAALADTIALLDRLETFKQDLTNSDFSDGYAADKLSIELVSLLGIERRS